MVKDLEKIVFFDIETCGKYKDFEELNRNDPNLANAFCKKINFIDKSIKEDLSPEEKNNFWNKNCSFYPEYSKIVCISYGKIGDSGEFRIKTLQGEEIEILKNFVNICKISNKNKYYLCGWNIKNFDIPWIYRKLLSYKLELPEYLKIINKKSWELQHIIDLKEIWYAGSTLSSTFEEALLSCEIESPKLGPVNCSNVHEAYYYGNKSQIYEYCEKDVKSLYLFYKVILNSL